MDHDFNNFFFENHDFLVDKWSKKIVKKNKKDFAKKKNFLLSGS